MIKDEKPMLDTDGLIKHLQSKGVRFDIMSVDEAKQYLRDNNNYFKLCAYRKNFPKHPDGSREGQYINLDFALLKDLSIIDMRMRYVFIQMALDIEHFAKVKLLTEVENSKDDGYQIVQNYINELATKDKEKGTNRSESLLCELQRGRKNPYCGGIIEKYDGCYPVWAFVEIASLGTVIDFYGFCAKKLNNKKLKDEYYLLVAIKDLRNAAAHSNCIIHNMGAKDRSHNPNYKMLSALNNISKATKDNQLNNERMLQITTLLYTHTIFVKSTGVHNHNKENLNALVSRIEYHIDYYNSCGNIQAGFKFFKDVVDKLFP